MALQMNYGKPPISVPNCYWSIDRITGDKHRGFSVVLGVYPSSTDKKAFAFEIVQIPFVSSVGTDMYAMVYKTLKTLPEFSTATDV